MPPYVRYVTHAHLKSLKSLRRLFLYKMNDKKTTTADKRQKRNARDRARPASGTDLSLSELCDFQQRVKCACLEIDDLKKKLEEANTQLLFGIKKFSTRYGRLREPRYRPRRHPRTN